MSNWCHFVVSITYDTKQLKTWSLQPKHGYGVLWAFKFPQVSLRWYCTLTSLWNPTGMEGKWFYTFVIAGTSPSRLANSWYHLPVEVGAMEQRWFALWCSSSPTWTEPRHHPESSCYTSRCPNSRTLNHVPNLRWEKRSPALPGVCVCAKLLKRSKTCTFHLDTCDLCGMFYLDLENLGMELVFDILVFWYFSIPASTFPWHFLTNMLLKNLMAVLKVCLHVNYSSAGGQGLQWWPCLTKLVTGGEAKIDNLRVPAEPFHGDETMMWFSFGFRCCQAVCFTKKKGKNGTFAFLTKALRCLNFCPSACFFSACMFTNFSIFYEASSHLLIYSPSCPRWPILCGSPR